MWVWGPSGLAGHTDWAVGLGSSYEGHSLSRGSGTFLSCDCWILDWKLVWFISCNWNLFYFVLLNSYHLFGIWAFNNAYVDQDRICILFSKPKTLFYFTLKLKGLISHAVHGYWNENIFTYWISRPEEMCPLSTSPALSRSSCALQVLATWTSSISLNQRNFFLHIPFKGRTTLVSCLNLICPFHHPFMSLPPESPPWHLPPLQSWAIFSCYYHCAHFFSMALTSIKVKYVFVLSFVNVSFPNTWQTPYGQVIYDTSVPTTVLGT